MPSPIAAYRRPRFSAVRARGGGDRDGATIENMHVIEPDIDTLASLAPDLPDDVMLVVLDDTEPDAHLLAVEADLLGPGATDRRRRAFTLGRAAARRALHKLGRGSPPILQGPAREPLWPDGVIGSITHTDGVALAAVAAADRYGGIGLDLEHRGRWFPEMEAQVAFGEELRWLQSLAPDARAAATVELFSAKESVYKAFFPRIQRYFGFEAARLRRPADPEVFVGYLGEPLDPSYPPTRRFRVDVQRRGDLILTSVVLPVDATTR